ncbi:MAG: gliding motility-associated C-terminal domain-containing protein [Saprospiraceae bacterium]
MSDPNILVFDCTIYDRWGNIMYNVNNTNDIRWNGKMNVEHVVSGVYVYYFRYVDGNEEIKEVFGDLTVVY